MTIKNDMKNDQITPADCNVVLDLGFEQDESAKILAEVDRQIADMLAEIENTSN